MDGDRFDQLTKSLTEGTSRRGLLRWLAGGVLGGILGFGGLSTAAAACLDDCARRPTARARVLCRRSCAQRGRTAPAQGQRGQGIYYPPPPDPTPAWPERTSATSARTEPRGATPRLPAGADQTGEWYVRACLLHFPGLSWLRAWASRRL